MRLFNKKSLLIVLIKLTLTTLVFYVISKRVNINPFIYLNANNVNYFLAAILVSIILIFLQALRWQHLIKLFSINLSYKKCLTAIWFGHFINNFLPTSSAGDLMRSYTLKYTAKKNKWGWVNAFIAEKYSAATAALLLASCMLATPLAHRLPTTLIILVVSLFAIFLLAPPASTKIIGKILKSYEATFTKYLPLNTFTSLLKIFTTAEGRHAFGTSILINITMCGLFYLIGHGIGANIGFMECLFTVPIFTLLATLPISYAGWGVRELSCAGLLSFFGIPSETAIIVSILYGLINVLSCIPGIFFGYPFLLSMQKLSEQNIKSA